MKIEGIFLIVYRQNFVMYSSK